MKPSIRPVFLALVALLCTPLPAREAENASWTVDGVAREGLIYRATGDGRTRAPLVFVFHGHGGSMH